MEVARHRTALFRSELSRPLRLATQDGIIGPGATILDYGCGRGGDVRRLREAGFECRGWDPVHAPDGERRRSAVVNLGYVVNVIERPDERVETLRRAWDLAEEVLVVSARLVDERPLAGTSSMADGLVTRLGTFQKFFEQQELRNWVDSALGETSVAAAPGVFYVFRSAERRSAFVVSRYRRAAVAPRLRVSERLAAEHRDLLDALAAFLVERGRPPEADEIADYDRIVSELGSIRRAYRLLLKVSDAGAWEGLRSARMEDLLVFLALSRFDGRPRMSDLPLAMQADVRAFFGSYSAGCRMADDLLFGLGDQARIDEAARTSPLGKLLPTALYVHVDAVGEMPVLLRLYEGCARATLGTVDGATLVKLRRDEPKASYLCYPDFDTDPHPALAESVSIHLQTFRTRTRRYGDSSNPPVLHRKEAFLPTAHPLRARFARLTRAEEKAGLLEDSSEIGTRAGWDSRLQMRGYRLAGHRLLRTDAHGPHSRSSRG